MRRIGSTPQQRGSTTGATCPDVIELNDGRFYVIGKVAHLKLPEWERLESLGAAVDDDEQAVVVPRDAMLTAARQLVAEDAGEAEARGAYRAYSVITQGLNFRGDPMPEWDDLPAKIRTAWVNAAMGVRNRALMEAADKQRAWADSYGTTPTQEAVRSIIREAAALIDPRDPRSLADG